RHLIRARTAIEVEPHRHAARVPRPIEMLADDNVHEPVAVDVAEADTARRVVRGILVLPFDVRMGGGHLVEAAFAVVDEEAVAAVASGQEDVRPAVAIDVGRRHAEAGHAFRQTHGLRDILELEAAQVAKQPRAALAPLEETLADEKVEQTVAV